jgi:ribulose-5-phosphate 4-epimerase/fuculose-1-phosphate aldolase
MPRSIAADRRRFLFVGAGALLWSLGAGRPAAAAPSSLVRELIAAQRILAHHGVAGSVSVRDGGHVGRYLVRPGDVVGHDLATGSVGDADLAAHAAIYRAHPGVRAIARVRGIRGAVTGATLPEVVFHAVSTHQAAGRRIRP